MAIPVFDIGRILIFGVKIAAIAGIFIALDFVVDSFVEKAFSFINQYLPVVPEPIRDFLSHFIDSSVFNIVWVYIKFKISFLILRLFYIMHFTMLRIV